MNFKSIMARTALVATTGSMLFIAIPSASASSTGTATINATVSSAIDLTVANPSFGAVTPGGAAVTGAATVSLTTSSTTGYSVSAKGTLGSCTTAILCAGARVFADTGTAYSGTGLAVDAARGNGLSFRIKNAGADAQLAADVLARWGTDATTEKYAAFPTAAAQEIISTVTAQDGSGSAHAFTVDYGVKASLTQAAVSYTGTVTYTGVTAP
jgi:hypothetical protein